MNQPLTVQAIGGVGVDEYGNNLPAAQGVAVAEFGYLEQTSTVEFIDSRQTVVSHWECYLFPGSTVAPLSFVNFRGSRWQVDGQPWAVYNPRTQAISHMQCKLIVVL